MEAQLQGSEQQFTVFYSGRVNIFHHIPAHKAQAIMLLLSDNHTSMRGRNSFSECGTDSMVPRSLVQTEQPQLACKNGSAKASCVLPCPSTPSMPTTDKKLVTPFTKKQGPTISKRSQAELPFARKASLARFLEKRKDRVLEATKKIECVSASKDGDVEGALGSQCKRMKP